MHDPDAVLGYEIKLVNRNTSKYIDNIIVGQWLTLLPHNKKVSGSIPCVYTGLPWFLSLSLSLSLCVQWVAESGSSSLFTRTEVVHFVTAAFKPVSDRHCNPEPFWTTPRGHVCMDTNVQTSLTEHVPGSKVHVMSDRVSVQRDKSLKPTTRVDTMQMWGDWVFV